MTISNQYLLAALIVFMTVSVALFVLRFRTEWKRLRTLELQNAERKQREEASDRRSEQHRADMAAMKAQTEVFATRAEQLQIRYTELTQRKEELCTRTENTVARMEALLDRIEKRNNL